MAQALWKAQQENEEHATAPVTDDKLHVCTVQDLKLDEGALKWDYGVPTLVRNYTPDAVLDSDDELAMDHAVDVHATERSSDEAPVAREDRNQRTNDFIEHLLEVCEGKAWVAGGAAMAICEVGDVVHPKDYDFFLVAASDEEYKEIYRKLMAAARDWTKANKMVFVYHNGNVVTFHAGFAMYEVQVILTRYACIAEVLYSFDISVCQMAYNGTDVVMTPLCKLSIELGVFPVDFRTSSRTYRYRIHKYITKGFRCAMYGALDTKAPLYPNAAVTADKPCRYLYEMNKDGVYETLGYDGKGDKSIRSYDDMREHNDDISDERHRLIGWHTQYDPPAISTAYYNENNRVNSGLFGVGTHTPRSFYGALYDSPLSILCQRPCAEQTSEAIRVTLAVLMVLRKPSVARKLCTPLPFELISEVYYWISHR